MVRVFWSAVLGLALFTASAALAGPSGDAGAVIDRSAIEEALAPEAGDTPAPAATRGVRLKSVDLRVPFEKASDRLSPGAATQLDELAAALKTPRLQSQSFRIIGHTDRSGSFTYNMTLSAQRALAVKTYLVERHGVDPAKLATIGLGYSQPKMADDVYHPDNRRVEITTLSAK